MFRPILTALCIPASLTLTALTFTALLGSPSSAQGDPEVIARILEEGRERSQVWETLTYLSEEIGPRLTGSTNLARANAWTRDEFRRMGLKNAHLFKWGDVPVRFDRGPSHARVIAPFERELEFTAPSWSAGTDGPLRAPIRLRPETLAEVEAIGWDFEGTWVLTPAARRGARSGGGNATARAEREAIDQALAELNVAGTLTSTGNELVITDSVRNWRALTMDALPTGIDVRIRESDYEALREQVLEGEEVIVEIDLAHHFAEGPFGVYNTIAEIPGTEKPDEVLIFSGHLDSWDGPGSMGTQDNGTGSAVMLETARILMAAGVKPKRTIRFILWSGEEQGLFGSFGYVASLSEEERARISGCFVDDGGTGYQGGLMCIPSQLEMLDRAIAPVADAFPDFPMENTARERMPRGGASDHAPFNQVGIPGYFWKESGETGREGKNYTFVHHTQHDTLRYAVKENLVQSACCSAVVAYQLAQADTLLPRESSEATPSKPKVDPSFVVTEGPYSGKWRIALSDTSSPAAEFTLELEHAVDGRLRGQLDGATGETPLERCKVDPDSGRLSFRAVTDFGKLDFDASLEEGRLRGTLVAMGNNLAFEGERVGAAPVAAEAPAGDGPVEAGLAFPLAGSWIGYIEAKDSEFTMTLERSESELGGRFQSIGVDSPLADASWDGLEQVLTFAYDHPTAGRRVGEAKLAGDKLVGHLGADEAFVATLKKPKEPAFVLEGRWVGYIESMDSEFDVKLTSSGGVVQGRFQSSQSDSELHDAKWDPRTETLTFEYDYPHAGRLPFVARLQDGKLVGKIGQNAEFVATRASAAKKP